MYFVIENNTRPDGIVNTSTTARSNLAGALSLYHDRYSKLMVSDLYTKSSLLLVDADLNIIQHDVIDPSAL